MSKASETVVFEYNADGLRVRKIATSTGTTHYTLHGKQITHLTNGNNTLHFFYDASGKPAMVEWNNGTTTQKFAYIHNLQGDIVALIDSTGTKVVSYTYDAWGKPLSTTGSLASTLGKLNPFRYRGYVFDEETGLYYLRSRYYNNNCCRFINADSIINTNIFSYCKNEPVQYYDTNGRECSKCTDGVGRFSYIYYLNEAQSQSFSLWLSEASPREQLTPLYKEIIMEIIPGLFSYSADKAIESQIATNYMKSRGGNALAMWEYAQKGYSAVSFVVSMLSDLSEPIRMQRSETLKNIKEFYTETRSGYGGEGGTVIEVFVGFNENILTIHVLTKNGPISYTWKDQGVLDAVNNVALGDVMTYLAETYTPIFHDHPEHGVYYADYEW